MNLQRLYAYRFRGVDQQAKSDVWVEIAQHVHRLLDEPVCVLDPAAGRGEFINAVPAAERWAVDKFAYAEGTYAPGVKAVVSDIFESDLPPEHFDGVFVSNFLEHLSSQDEVAEFIELLHRCTKPGGRIAIMGPNFRYCSAEYFDMADHTVALTHRSVAEHLFAGGFEPDRIVPRFLPYSFTGILPPSPALTRAYLRVPLAWRVLGKQFLVTARR